MIFYDRRNTFLSNGFGFFPSNEARISSLTKPQNISLESSWPLKNKATVRGVFGLYYENEEQILVYGNISLVASKKSGNLVLAKKNAYSLFSGSEGEDICGGTLIWKDRVMLIGNFGRGYYERIDVFICSIINLNCSAAELAKEQLKDFAQLKSLSTNGEGEVRFAFKIYLSLLFSLEWKKVLLGYLSKDHSYNLIKWNDEQLSWSALLSNISVQNSSDITALFFTGNKYALISSGNVTLIQGDSSFTSTFFWIEGNKIFAENSTQLNLMGRMYHAVKSHQASSLYILTEKGVFNYLRNTTSHTGFFSDVTSFFNFPLPFGTLKLESNEKGRIFLVSQTTGNWWGMYEKNPSIWNQYKTLPCSACAPSLAQSILAFSNSKIFSTCPTLNCDSGNVEVYDVTSLATSRKTYGRELGLFSRIPQTFSFATASQICRCAQNQFLVSIFL